MIFKTPHAVYVEKLCPENTFSSLNLATPVMGLYYPEPSKTPVPTEAKD